VKVLVKKKERYFIETVSVCNVFLTKTISYIGYIQ